VPSRTGCRSARLLVITQTDARLPGAVARALVATGLVEYWHVAALGLLLGFAKSSTNRAPSVRDGHGGKNDVASAVAN